MNIWDILIILVVAAAVFAAARHVVKTRRSGGCGCGCEGCTKDCSLSGVSADSREDLCAGCEKVLPPETAGKKE